MAKAITQINKEIPDPVEEETEALTNIIQELSLNSEAILETIRLIKGLHETKVLESANAFFEQRTEIGAIAIQQINQPAMHNIIKNAINTVKFLGSLQPGQLDTIFEGLNRGLMRMKKNEQQEKKQSIWKLRKRIWSPQIRAALTSLVDFMDGMGEVFLRNRRESP